MSSQTQTAGVIPSAPSADGAEDPPPDRDGLNEQVKGQLILGIDKRNPVFAVYEDESGQHLIVYYGFEILETVTNDPQAAGFRLLLGRLYNAGIKLKSLCESFGLAPKTIRGWGQALLKGDPEHLLRVLEGRNAKRKRTSQVQSFARLRWPELVAQGAYGAVKRLQGEIQGVFEVSISRSGLRPLIRELKTGSAPQPSPAQPSPSEPEDAGLPPQAVARPPGAENENGQRSAQCPAPAPREESGGCAAAAAISDTAAAVPPANTGHLMSFFPKDPSAANYWCEHAGALIFSRALNEVAQAAPIEQPILAQWLCALSLGAHNIEQTKFLHWEDLGLILGGVVCFPTPQRQKLKELAQDEGVLGGLWRFNLKNLGGEVGSDFYFDPHSKQYTGEQNVLKGWCPQIRSADKVLHSDFIHSVGGEPVYFETTDNFTDLRQRFLGVIERARRALQWPEDRTLSFVVDRGVYGAEFFEKVVAQPHLHVITWQKGFVPGAWEPQKVMGTTTITRLRNCSTDLRGYRFEYVEGPWESNAALRRIVVQATNDKGRTIQVAILTDDLERAAAEIIRLIFTRWLQENDFKYLDKHYGINEITSYESVDYEELKGQVEDRQIKSAALKMLEASQKKETERLKRHLLAREQAQSAHQVRAQKRQALEEQLARETSPESPQSRVLIRSIALLESADHRYEETQAQRQKAVEQSQKQIEEIQGRIKETPATESRLEGVISGQMVKMEGQCKRLLDVLRISARNLFYRALAPFKKAYDNYRDDHEHFRKLTQSPGVLEVREEQIVVHLMPRSNYGRRMRSVMEATLEDLNSKGLEHPCLPGRKLKFRLGHRREMEVKMNVDA